MKRLFYIGMITLLAIPAMAGKVSFGKGTLNVRQIARNAVRIQYYEQPIEQRLPEWLYVKDEEVKSKDITVDVDASRQRVVIRNKKGEEVFSATAHQMQGSEATLSFNSPQDEHLYGLGQFQDGFNDVRGLSRRLTQVNTQISIPMLLSSKGYGVLWNNYGMVEFNPCRQRVALQLGQSGEGGTEVVNVTTTEGGRREVRQRNIFEAGIDLAEDGDYSLLLDVGQKMARRHNLTIDGQTVIEMQNTWLPPTASTIVRLKAGHHVVKAELSRGDHPVLYYDKVQDETVLRSPVAQAVDYTVFVGTPDEIIASYRHLTGDAPLMPRWALGYIHCRERFHSSDEILQTANRFRKEKMPVDVIVQDWQYWGKYGWNSMRFDEQFYPDPKALTDSLHAMNMRLMVSVWSKIDKNSEVGKQMGADNYYIPGTDWIDFFNPDAAAAYWKNFSDRLVPLGIDAWWQDATEPENDDLLGRRVNNGKWSGEEVRNVYPLLVNKTVYEGLTSASAVANSSLFTLPSSLNRPMILTRCGFPGIQRYGSAMWSGDVGNDWETFRRQITAGLGMQAAGIPWWTYDAGGFFRPGNQYTDQAYIDRMLRWIETSVYLPLMRVHGYMSNTEPWNYGPEAKQIISDCLQERYRLLPYIYSIAANIAFDGSTLMRPLVFDFADDAEALDQKYEYMFGPALLISPVTEPDVKTWKTYLPKTQGGWYDYHTGQHYDGGQTVTTTVTKARIPVFVRAGSIIPMSNDELHVYPGADASFTLYEDDGVSMAYQNGQCSRITFQWKDAKGKLKTSRQKGHDFKITIHNTKKMKKTMMSAAMMALTAMAAQAQNPFVQTWFTSDPAPMVCGDRMYVYTGHDEDNADFFWMQEWRVYSTEDMVNWTDHGSPLALESFSWADDRAWASQTIERDGKYYWYICAHSKLSGGMAIGVAVSDSPTGPFKDALGKPLFENGSWDHIDPTVMIDDDGQAWLMWGNPQCYYLKLNRDMISYSGELGRLDMTEEAFGGPIMSKREKGKQYKDSYVEGPWLTKRNGVYQLLYAAGGVPEHIAYSTASSPTGPWKYAGEIMPLSNTGSFTNHCGVADFKGHSYFFYHTGKLPKGGGFGRSVAVEEFKYNADGSFPKILPTDEGVKPIATFNPYQKVQAETMAFSRGVKTEQNDEIGVYVTEIHNGDYIKLQNVKFDGNVSKQFFARVASGLRGGKIEVRIDSLRGKRLATLEVPATGGWEKWQTLSVDFAEKAEGTHDLYFVFTGRKGPKLFNFDWWEIKGLQSLVVEEGGLGKYKAIMKEEATLEAHTIFVPQDLSAFNKKNPLPVLVWGNGACTNSPWEHYKFLNEIASHGYIVLATGYIPMEEKPYNGPMSTTQQQIESIDWIIAQNADKNSPYYQKIDVKNICVAGMSCGGLQTLYNCADPRIKTLMICNSGLFKNSNRNQAVGGMPMPDKSKLKDIHSSIIYILGGKEDIAYENGMDDFHLITHVPCCAANFPVGHGGTYRQPHGGEFSVVALNWLNWQLKGDKQSAKMFKGKDCGLSKRQGWTIEKNAKFDKLK